MRLLLAGASGGIGGAVKRAAVARGWEVVEIGRDWFEGTYMGTDPMEGMRDVDAVVFAVGCCPVRPAALTADRLLEETLRVNCGYFLKLMREVVAGRHYGSGGMKAIAVSSVSATEGWAGGAAYCASKGALSALCRALDVEWKAKGVSVVAMEPRYVRTKMFAECAGRMGVPESLAEDPAAFAEKVLEKIET